MRILVLVCGLGNASFTLFNYFANDVSTGVVNSLLLCTVIAISDVVFED